MSALDDLKQLLEKANPTTPVTITVEGQNLSVTAGDLDLALGIALPAINPPPPPNSQGQNRVVYATTTLNVRSAPSTSGNVIEQIASGTGVVAVLGVSQVTADGHVWQNIQLADGTVGWAATDYLAITPPGSGGGNLNGPLFADLSRYNTNVTLSVAKANGLAGIINKATEGITYTDSTFAGRKSEAAAAGLYFGAYHFGVGESDPVAQADYFLGVAAGVTVLVLDFEKNPDPSGSTMSVAQAEAFVQHIQQKTGRWPVLYTSPGFWGSNSSGILANCPLWVAAWGDAPIVPSPWQTWTFWQFTDSNSGPQPHSLTGIGAADFDRFNGDDNTVKTFFGG